MKLADLIPQPSALRSEAAFGFNVARAEMGALIAAVEAAGYILAHKSDVGSYAQQEAA